MLLPLGVGLAGVAGALLRFWLDSLLTTRFPRAPLPLATLLVNLVSSGLLGIVGAWPQQDSGLPLAALLGVGFLGGLSTFSSLLVASATMWLQGQRAQSCCNLLTHVVGGVGAVWAGYTMGIALLAP